MLILTMKRKNTVEKQLIDMHRRGHKEYLDYRLKENFTLIYEI